MFFNVGGGEILVIAMVALIAVGPEQLPLVLRKAGKAMGQVRGMTSGLRDEFMSGVDDLSEISKPEAWMGKGTTDDPIVPKGYAERHKAAGQAAKEEADPGSSTTAASASAGPGGEAENGDKPVVNQIAQANARSAQDPHRPKPSIGGRSTAAPRPATVEPDEAPTETPGSETTDAETTGAETTDAETAGAETAELGLVADDEAHGGEEVEDGGDRQ